MQNKSQRWNKKQKWNKNQKRTKITYKFSSFILFLIDVLTKLQSQQKTKCNATTKTAIAIDIKSYWIEVKDKWKGLTSKKTSCSTTLFFIEPILVIILQHRYRVNKLTKAKTTQQLLSAIK